MRYYGSTTDSGYLQSISDGSQYSVSLTKGTTYYLYVLGDEGAATTITITYVGTIEYTSISSLGYQSVSGGLAAGESAYYVFTAPYSGTYSFYGDYDSISVDLIDSNLNVISSSGSYTMSEGGTVYIRVTNEASYSYSGVYFYICITSITGMTQLSFDNDYSLSGSGWYTFTVEESTYYDFAFTGSGTASLYYSGYMYSYWTNYSFSDSTKTRYLDSDDGPYYLYVETDGTVNFSISSAARETIEEDTSVSITMKSGETKLYSFTPSESGYYTISASVSNGDGYLDGNLDLYLSSGNCETVDYLNEGTEYDFYIYAYSSLSLALTITSTTLEELTLDEEETVSLSANESVTYSFSPNSYGYYTYSFSGLDSGSISVSLPDNSSKTLSDDYEWVCYLSSYTTYLLTVVATEDVEFTLKVEEAQPTELTADTAQTVSMSSYDEVKLYSFTPSTGGIYTFNVKGLNGNSVYIEAFDRNFTISDDFSRDAVLSADEEYTIYILSYSNSVSFTIEMATQNSVTEITTGTGYGTTIDVGGTVIYQFTASTEGSYVFYSTGDSDTYGYLYDEDGGLLTSNDDSGEGTNFKITYSLKQNQTVNLLVRAYSDYSAYTCYVYVEKVTDDEEE